MVPDKSSEGTNVPKLGLYEFIAISDITLFEIIMTTGIIDFCINGIMYMLRLTWITNVRGAAVYLAILLKMCIARSGSVSKLEL
jgi:hypothetical protein